MQRFHSVLFSLRAPSVLPGWVLMMVGVITGATHTAMPMFRTLDILLSSSGLIRAAAASGVMFAAASSLACCRLEFERASAWASAIGVGLALG